MAKEEPKITTIAIDKTLAEEIDKLLKVIPGYFNRSEFARDAIRREVLRVKKEQESKGVSDEPSR